MLAPPRTTTLLACTLELLGLLAPAHSLDNGLALTPVMGWSEPPPPPRPRRPPRSHQPARRNTWDHFRCSGGEPGGKPLPAGLGHPCNAAMDNCVSEVLIRQVADAIVERGLKSAGYQYVNLSAPGSCPSTPPQSHPTD